MRRVEIPVPDSQSNLVQSIAQVSSEIDINRCDHQTLLIIENSS